MEEKPRWAKVLSGDPRIDRYKWEFLRRNRDFRRDYSALAHEFPEWISEYGGLICPAPMFYPEQLSAALQNLQERWGVMDPIDPSLPGTAKLPPDVDPPSFDRPHQTASGSACAVTQWFGDTRPRASTATELRYLEFQIDILQPLEIIFAELESHIELARIAYQSHIGPLPSFRKRRRARLEEYESYLKAWDLRMQGFTFEQIASRLFPREMKKLHVRDAMLKRVRSQFQRAKKLIEGEYRQIGG